MIIRLLYWLPLHYQSNTNIMVQIKVSEDLADTLKWKSKNIETERKYLLDALCETIISMYQPDDIEATCNMREFFPLWQLADYKRLLDSLEKGFEITEAK